MSVKNRLAHPHTPNIKLKFWKSLIKWKKTKKKQQQQKANEKEKCKTQNR